MICIHTVRHRREAVGRNGGDRLLLRNTSGIAPIVALAGALVVAGLVAGGAAALAFTALGVVDAGSTRWLLGAHLAVVLATSGALLALLPHAGDAVARDGDEDAVATWIDWWREGLLDRTDDPPGRLPDAAIEAFLRLREAATDASSLDALGGRYGVREALARDLENARGPDLARALEDVGRGRIASALDLVLSHLDPRVHPVVRRAALRAAARIHSALSPHGRREGAEAFVAALRSCGLPAEVVAEALGLLGAAAPAILPPLLSDPSLPPSILRGAIRAAGRLRSHPFVHLLQAFASHPDAEARAAAWRALVSIGRLPPAGADLIRASVRDDEAFVRVHATRAAGLLPVGDAIEVLWGRLGDRSWWVRLAAAETLRGLGSEGEESLAQAAARHPDAFARDMARQHAQERDRSRAS